MYGGYGYKPESPDPDEPENVMGVTDEEKRVDYRLHRMLRFVPVGDLVEDVMMYESGTTIGFRELTMSQEYHELISLAESTVDIARAEQMLKEGLSPLKVGAILL